MTFYIYYWSLWLRPVASNKFYFRLDYEIHSVIQKLRNAFQLRLFYVIFNNEIGMMISNFQSTNYWLVGIGRRVFLANSKKSILSFCHSDKRTIILCNSYIGISTLSCPLLMPLELGIEVQLLLAYQTRKSYQTLPHINFVTKKVQKLSNSFSD